VPPLHPEEPEPRPEEPTEGARKRGRPRPQAVEIVSIHGPVSQKECEQCHAGSRSNRLLMSKQELCWSCHNRADFPGKVVHPPVEAGFCDACHDPHRSQYAYLLVRAPSELCQGCHDASTDPTVAEHRAVKGDDCRSCHDPHATDRKFMLKRDEEPS